MSVLLPPTFSDGFRAFLNAILEKLPNWKRLLKESNPRTILWVCLKLLESSLNLWVQTMPQVCKKMQEIVKDSPFAQELFGGDNIQFFSHFRQAVLGLKPADHLGSAKLVEFLNRTAIVQEALRRMGSGSMRLGGVATGWLHRGWSVSSWETFAQHFADVFREDPSCKVEGKPVQEFYDKAVTSSTIIRLGRMQVEGPQDWQNL